MNLRHAAALALVGWCLEKIPGVIYVTLLVSVTLAAGARLAIMNSVTSVYQGAFSSLINLHSECETILPSEIFDDVNRILIDVKRRLRKIEPMLKDSFRHPASVQTKPLGISK